MKTGIKVIEKKFSTSGLEGNITTTCDLTAQLDLSSIRHISVILDIVKVRRVIERSAKKYGITYYNLDALEDFPFIMMHTTTSTTCCSGDEYDAKRGEYIALDKAMSSTYWKFAHLVQDILDVINALFINDLDDRLFSIIMAGRSADENYMSLLSDDDLTYIASVTDEE